MKNRAIGVVAFSGLLMGSVIASAAVRNGKSAIQEPANAQLIAQLAAAKKPAVGQPLVIDGKTVCGPNGNTSNTKMKDLNNNKNRIDEPQPSDYVPIDWELLRDLPADKVSDIQGAPVSVVGYLSSRVKPEIDAPGESTNCNLLDQDEVDWHMYLTESPNQPIKDAIIVETTPRVRPNHKWTLPMLKPYPRHDKKIRISGWLIYDFQHVNVIGKERATAWEVHPITLIEVQDAQGNWVNIEE
jgi:hypothetical protein